MKGYFQQAWLVLGLAVVLGSALAMVDHSLQPRIQENARRSLEAAVLEVVPGGSESTEQDLEGHVVYRVSNDAGETVGWAVPAQNMGFADKIQLLVGVSADARTITGLAILSSTETPGLGDKIRDEEFRSQYAGKPASAELSVVKPGQTAAQPIHAITGATISSKAVTEAVNRRLAEVRSAIERAGGDTAESSGSGKPAAAAPDKTPKNDNRTEESR